MAVAPASADALIDLCRKSGVVEEKELKRLLNSITLPADPTHAASVLINKGLLTRFQASQLLLGRHRGFLIGPYKVLDKLGRGQNASVFLCEQVVMRRRVALKVLPEQHARDPGVLERFYREARAAAVLDHPNVVHTYDINSAGELHYIAMEYVEGTDLQRVLERSVHMPHDRAVGYALQAAAGLQHAHSKGLVHRDIKPANLLVSKDGVVKLLDMGLARFFADPKDDLTKQFDNSPVLDTIDYLAPEQAIPSSSVDARADIYGLGATLYALISGKPPFEGTVTQKLLLVQMRIPPPLVQLRHEIPPKLSAAVARMMAKDVKDRFQSIAEVIEALTPFAPGPVEDTPGSTVIAKKTVSRTESPAAPATHHGGAKTKPAMTSVRSGVASPSRSSKAPQPVPASVRRVRRQFWLAVAGSVLGLAIVAILIVVVQRAKEVEPISGNHQTGVKKTPGVDPTLTQNPDPLGVGRVVYRLEAADQAPFFERRRGRETLQKNGSTRPPRSWSFGSWKPETTGEFMIQDVRGTIGFGMRCIDGEPAVQLTSTLDDRLRGLPVGNRAAVRFRYFAEHDAKGFAAIRLKGYKPLARVELQATGNQWMHGEIKFTAVADMHDFTVQATTAGSRCGVFITDVEFVDRELPPFVEERLFHVDFTAADPFVFRVHGEQVERTTGTGDLPGGWLASTAKETSTGEVFAEKVGPDMAIGLRHAAGESSLQLLSRAALAACRDGGHYQFRVEYRADGGSRGNARVRYTSDGSDIVVCDLRPAGSQWRTARFDVYPNRNGELFLVLQNLASDPRPALRVKSIEVVELR